jgi:hypothetical protein
MLSDYLNPVIIQRVAQGSLMMEAVRTSETSVDNQFTRQYIPEDNSEHHLSDICFCMHLDSRDTTHFNVILRSNLHQPSAKPGGIWDTFVWPLSFDLSDMVETASSYAAVSIALHFKQGTQSLRHEKAVSQGGCQHVM